MENYILRNYGVVFKYFKNAEEFTQIHFSVDVTYSGQSQNGKHYFNIDRKKVFINETAPDLILEQLAESAGSCLYPMEIITSDEGPFEGIANYEAIKKRWKDKKAELESYYEGEMAENIISKLDSIYSDQHKMELSMKKDLFLNLFFMPIYRKHTNRIATYEHSITFASLNRAVSYDIVQEVEPYLTATKKQKIQLKGHSEEAFTKEPELSFLYKINNETKSIYSITGSVNLEKFKKNIKKVEIQMFQQREN